MISEPVNFNTVHFETYESVQRALIEQLGEDEERFQELLNNDLDQFIKSYQALKAMPFGTELIVREELLGKALEQFLESVDSIVNFSIADEWYTFDEADLTTDEALALVPGYTAAKSLFPLDPYCLEGEIPEPYIPAFAEEFGFVLKERDLFLLMESLERPESIKAVKEINLADQHAALIYAFHQVDGFSKEKNLTELLTAFRERRERLKRGYVLLICRAFPELHHFRKGWVLDPRTITYPILEQRRMQGIWEEFSYNDLSHGSFLTVVTRLKEQYIQSKTGKYFREEFMIVETEEYRNALEPFQNSSLWTEFNESESIWYRDLERIFLCMKNCFESLYCDDEEKWNEHEASSTFQAAEELWNELPHNPFGHWMFLARGFLVGNSQWHTMRDLFGDVKYQILLEEIGAKELYHSCVEADRESCRIADQIHPDGKEGLEHLRHLRGKLHAELNYTKSCVDTNNSDS